MRRGQARLDFLIPSDLSYVLGINHEVSLLLKEFGFPLQEVGELDNTLLVFVSDNGGSNEGHLNNTIERMKKPWKSAVIPTTTPDGGPLRPGALAQWAATRKEAREPATRALGPRT